MRQPEMKLQGTLDRATDLPRIRLRVPEPKIILRFNVTCPFMHQAHSCTTFDLALAWHFFDNSKLE